MANQYGPKKYLLLKCENCGIEYQRQYGAHLKKQRFCSFRCRNLAIVPRGSDHHKWRGGVSRPADVWRTVAARKRETKACEKCGSIEHLHAHHRQRYSDHPELRADPSNIQILCAPCHAAEHPEIANLVTFPHKRSGITIKCEICGKDKYDKKSREGRTRYCSVACRHQGLRNSVPYQCEACGKEGHVPASYLVHEGSRKFCSRECYDRARLNRREREPGPRLASL